jgi:hypothetical protein
MEQSPINSLAGVQVTREAQRITSVGGQRPRASTSSLRAVDSAIAIPADWPQRPALFPDLMTPIEAAQYLRLDQTGAHTPTAAVRTLNFWRDKGQLKATKFARHVWFRKVELDRFLSVKTET